MECGLHSFSLLCNSQYSLYVKFSSLQLNRAVAMNQEYNNEAMFDRIPTVVIGVLTARELRAVHCKDEIQ